MNKILFVCLGNICRSPSAQGVFQAKINKMGLADQFFIDSAGTAAWHIGKSPDSRSVLAAQARGYDLSALQARQVDDTDFERFDYILAMDADNLQNLQESCPKGYLNKLALFLPYGEFPETFVPDPYYGGSQGFERVLDLLESASDGFIKQLFQV
mgnify:CR=1 FL=1